MKSMPGVYKLQLLLLLAYRTAATPRAIIDLKFECKIHKDKITISGYSAGGGMTQIFHFSHSRLLMGIGLFSSEAYNCRDPQAPDQSITTLKDDAKPTEEYSNRTIPCLANLEQLGLIDPLSDLWNQRLYNWIGTRDPVLSVGTHVLINDLYCEYVGGVSRIRTVVQRGTHEVPRMHPECESKADEACPAGSCGYINGPLEMLNFLFEEIGVKFAPPRSETILQPLLSFDQDALFKGIRRTLMTNEGFIYIPRKCQYRVALCYVHMFLHGCHQTPPSTNDRISQIKSYGFMEIGEENGIIFVFPQAITCFDTHRGSTTKNFCNKKGPQVRALYRIVKRFLAN